MLAVPPPRTENQTSTGARPWDPKLDSSECLWPAEWSLSSLKSQHIHCRPPIATGKLPNYHFCAVCSGMYHFPDLRCLRWCKSPNNNTWMYRGAIFEMVAFPGLLCFGQEQSSHSVGTEACTRGESIWGTTLALNTSTVYGLLIFTYWATTTKLTFQVHYNKFNDNDYNK